jgi:hypothetical protein
MKVEIHSTCTTHGELRNAYKILVTKPQNLIHKIVLLDSVHHLNKKLQLLEAGFHFHLQVKKGKKDRKPICWAPWLS